MLTIESPARSVRPVDRAQGCALQISNLVGRTVTLAGGSPPAIALKSQRAFLLSWCQCSASEAVGVSVAIRNSGCRLQVEPKNDLANEHPIFISTHAHAAPHSTPRPHIPHQITRRYGRAPPDTLERLFWLSAGERLPKPLLQLCWAYRERRLSLRESTAQ